MCGRFYIADEDETGEIQRMIEEAARKQQAIVGESTLMTGEMCPGRAAPVYALGKSGAVGAFPMQWGFPGGKGSIINTRLETAAQKPLFRDAFLQRRCLLPMTCYFEWGEEDVEMPSLLQDTALQMTKKQRIRYQIRPRKEGKMYLAGIYRHEGPGKLPCFSVLTCQPHDSIAWLHDRMPVILSEQLAFDFLKDVSVAEKRERTMIFKAG